MMVGMGGGPIEVPLLQHWTLDSWSQSTLASARRTLSREPSRPWEARARPASQEVGQRACSAEERDRLPGTPRGGRKGQDRGPRSRARCPGYQGSEKSAQGDEQVGWPRGPGGLSSSLWLLRSWGWVCAFWVWWPKYDHEDTSHP